MGSPPGAVWLEPKQAFVGDHRRRVSLTNAPCLLDPCPTGAAELLFRGEPSATFAAEQLIHLCQEARPQDKREMFYEAYQYLDSRLVDHRTPDVEKPLATLRGMRSLLLDGGELEYP